MREREKNTSVVFQSPLQKTSFLTHLGNMGLIIVSEHLISQNRVSHLKLKKVL